MKKKLISALCIASIISSSIFSLPVTAATAAYYKPANIVVNGEVINVKGIIKDGRTLVPVRGIFEKLGFNVDWISNVKTAYLTDGNRMLEIQNGQSGFVCTDVKTGKANYITPDVPQQIVDERFYIPLRAISEAINAEVEWDSPTQTALIRTSSANTSSGIITSNGTSSTGGNSSTSSHSSEESKKSTGSTGNNIKYNNKDDDNNRYDKNTNINDDDSSDDKNTGTDKDNTKDSNDESANKQIYRDGASGVLGEIKWEISGDTLYISAVEGTKGRMPSNICPWFKTDVMPGVNNIVIRDGITEIYESDSEATVAIETIAIYENNIGDYIDITKPLDTITIPGSIKTIPSYAFPWCNVDKIIMNEGIISIEGGNFSSDIKEIVIPKSIMYIGTYVFLYGADNTNTSLNNVYGYKKSAAELLVKYLKYAITFEEDKEHVKFIPSDNGETVSPINIKANGTQIDYSYGAILSDMPLLPMKEICEALGVTVELDSKEDIIRVYSNKGSFSLDHNGNMLFDYSSSSKTIDERKPYPNYLYSSEIIDGEIMISLEILEDYLGCSVQLDETTRTINITK